MNVLPIECASHLIEKQVKILRCPAAVMWSQPQYVTGKLGRRGRRGSRARRTARLERCIVPARDRKARLFLCVSYAFLPESKKAFCFVATVTIRRFLPDLPMALPETKCGCVRIRTLFPKMYSRICDLCVIRRPME